MPSMASWIGWAKSYIGKMHHFGALTVVLDIADAVEHGVAHIEVAAGKINLCARSV